MADALIAYESERHGGLTLIDGHLRHEEADDVAWPVLVLDVNDEEADQLLLTLDPLAAMAETDPSALLALLADQDPAAGPGLTDVFQDLAIAATGEDDMLLLEQSLEGEGPPEMALQPYEHYDYVMLLYRNVHDWRRAKQLFELEDEGFTLRDGLTRKVGLGRVIDGRKLFELLGDETDETAEEPVEEPEPAAAE